MKSLYLLRGAPASGKSKFIEDNHLDEQTVSVSKIRKELYPSDDTSKRNWIPRSAQKHVWVVVYEKLEDLMTYEKTAILDASNLRTVDMEKLRPIAEKYDYTVKVVDFDATLEECLKRNYQRDPSDRISYRMISNYFSIYQYNPIPEGYIESTREELLEEVRT